MIQFRRGTTKAWKDPKITPLAPGQPGYDKDLCKIKIGDGKSSWDALPYVSGLHAKEILDTEYSAKNRYSQNTEDTTLITYGNETPDNNAIGQIYVKIYDKVPETDYIIKSGTSGLWTYQQYSSGITKCWCSIDLTTKVQDALESSKLFQSDTKFENIEYPFIFASTPTETATIQSAGSLAWLANILKNTETTAGVYSIISPVKQTTEAIYSLSLVVEGFCKLELPELDNNTEIFKQAEVYVKVK